MRYQVLDKNGIKLAEVDDLVLATSIAHDGEMILDTQPASEPGPPDVVLRSLVIRILERKIAIGCLETELAESKNHIYSTYWYKVLEAKKAALAGMKACQRLDEKTLEKWRF